MKRILSLCLALIMCVGLVGCGETKEKSSNLTIKISDNHKHFNISVKEFENIMNDKFGEFFPSNKVVFKEFEDEYSRFNYSANMTDNMNMMLATDKDHVNGFSIILKARTDEDIKKHEIKTKEFVELFNSLYNKDLDNNDMEQITDEQLSYKNENSESVGYYTKNYFLYEWYYSESITDIYNCLFSVSASDYENQNELDQKLSEINQENSQNEREAEQSGLIKRTRAFISNGYDNYGNNWRKDITASDGSTIHVLFNLDIKCFDISDSTGTSLVYYWNDNWSGHSYCKYDFNVNAPKEGSQCDEEGINTLIRVKQTFETELNKLGLTIDDLN